jgi:hypothetical protein
MLKRFGIVLGCLVWCAGCHNYRMTDWFNNERDRKVDRLWQQGYGYNNPNPNRIRDGQPPLNFDGSHSR